MVLFKRKVVCVLFAFLTLAGAVSFLAFSHFAVPLRPETPYFPDSSAVIANTHITIGEFRPVYLWAFRKNGGFFYKVAYRNAGGHIGVTDILAGGSFAGKKFEMTVVAEGDTKIQVNGENFSGLFGFAERIGVRYLLNSEKEISESEWFGSVVCTRNKNVCTTLEYIEEYIGNRYLDFSENKGVGVVPGVIPAYLITKEPRKGDI